MKKNEFLRDHTGKYLKTISYDDFKKSLDQGRKKILYAYETSIFDFLKELESNEYLKKEFSNEQIKRMILLGEKDIFVHLLTHNSYNYLSNINDRNFNDNFEFIKNYMSTMGFDLSNNIEQSTIQITMAYVFHIEFLKRIMTTVINFDKFGLKNCEKKSFGTIIHHIKNLKLFKNKFQNNEFINFLDSKKRNAIAYFSYFFKDSKIWLCKNGYFDPDPEPLDYYNLFLNTIEINVLSIAFYLIFLEKFLKKK